MANKKKKKPANNPARGFATVSIPSKMSEVDTADQSKESEELDQPLKIPFGQQQKRAPTSSDQQNDRDQDLSQMSLEELEQHFKRAEIQSMLDANGKRSRNDASRQKTRLETEHRSLRREAISLETDSWLAHVLQDILDLTRSSWPTTLTTQAAQKLSQADLCMGLWSLKLTLELIHLPHDDQVLREIIRISPIIPASDSKSPLWGFDEAVMWLALNSETNEFQPYDRQKILSSDPAVSRSRTPSPILSRRRQMNSSKNMSLDALHHSSSTGGLGQDTPPLRQDEAKNAKSISGSSDQGDDGNEKYEEESEDEDPERLTERFLNAKYEILKHSLSGDGNFDRNKLTQRIEKIECDVLFDRREADWRWAGIQKDLKTEHAQNSNVARRQDVKEQPAKIERRVPADGLPGIIAVSQEAIEEDDILGNLFDSAEHDQGVGEPDLSANVILRDFGALGTGVSPRRVLEDVCKAR